MYQKKDTVKSGTNTCPQKIVNLVLFPFKSPPWAGITYRLYGIFFLKRTQRFVVCNIKLCSVRTFLPSEPVRRFCKVRHNGNTHVQTGVVGKPAVAGQGHILLLPLLVQCFDALLVQVALHWARKEGSMWANCAWAGCRHSCLVGISFHISNQRNVCSMARFMQR